MTPRFLIIGIMLVGLAPGVDAQAPKASPPASTSAERVNVDRLPLDLQRLERQLSQSVEKGSWDGFRLHYTVEVYGKAPRIQFFDPKEVLPSGPIPYGAPTHQEMVEVMTPKEYRAPVMDFSALKRWLEEKLK